MTMNTDHSQYVSSRGRDSQRRKVYTAESIFSGIKVLRDEQGNPVRGTDGRVIQLPKPEHLRRANAYIGLEGAQLLTDRVMGDAVVRRHYGVPYLNNRGHETNEVRLPPTKIVGPTNGQRRGLSYPYQWKVSLPKHFQTPWVTLHELAHQLTDWKHGVDLAGHGWEFCQTYLFLVKRFLGQEAHDDLKAAFKRNGVRFTPKKPRQKKVMTPEQRAANIAQLQAARERQRAKRVGG